MAEILNASTEAVVAKWDKQLFVFKPNERREIENKYTARDILSRWGKYGLVDITYTPNLAKKYFDQELYIHDQRISVLNKMLERLLEVSQDYQSYEQECGNKPSVQRLKFKNKHTDVLAKIKSIEDMLDTLSKVDKQSLLKAKANKLREQAEELRLQAEALNGNNTGKPKNERENRVA